MILEMVQKHIPNKKLAFLDNNTEDNVLINSNFKCGFYINREKLQRILRSDKYRIDAAYDPSSYPGVKCKYYFNNEFGFDKDIQRGQITQEDRAMKLSELNDNKKYTEVSFMIFRTGSCLIVGNCSERILRFIFEFIKNILQTEYESIRDVNDEPNAKIKKAKIRKRTAVMTNQYFTDINEFPR
jgi:hypothetical protein